MQDFHLVIEALIQNVNFGLKVLEESRWYKFCLSLQCPHILFYRHKNTSRSSAKSAVTHCINILTITLFSRLAGVLEVLSHSFSQGHFQLWFCYCFSSVLQCIIVLCISGKYFLVYSAVFPKLLQLSAFTLYFHRTCKCFQFI